MKSVYFHKHQQEGDSTPPPTRLLVKYAPKTCQLDSCARKLQTVKQTVRENIFFKLLDNWHCHYIEPGPG